MFRILYKEMPGGFTKCITFGDDRVLLLLKQRYTAAMRKVPWAKHGSRIILKMLYRPAPFQYQRLQTFITKFLGSPSAADAGADHDGVILIHGPEFFLETCY